MLSARRAAVRLVRRLGAGRAGADEPWGEGGQPSNAPTADLLARIGFRRHSSLRWRPLTRAPAGGPSPARDRLSRRQRQPSRGVARPSDADLERILDAELGVAPSPATRRCSLAPRSPWGHPRHVPIGPTSCGSWVLSRSPATVATLAPPRGARRLAALLALLTAAPNPDCSSPPRSGRTRPRPVPEPACERPCGRPRASPPACSGGNTPGMSPSVAWCGSTWTCCPGR